VPPAQIRSMLQTLLTERFKLTVHLETRDLLVYALVTARRDGTLGSRLRRTEFACAARSGRPPTFEPDNPAWSTGHGWGKPGTGCDSGPQTRVGFGYFIGGGVTMSLFVRGLSGFLDRVVLDGTGLVGNFDFDLRWTPGSDESLSALPIQPPASLFTAVQQQLGLTLDAIRTPVDVLVIDHAEYPTGD
jgi:uncharacterized protein (TIGR03435 family)